MLVTGESGTGKEMLAHALHSLSPRHAKPLAIVDCGAIPASLMDSELFGRERGAFTGAERRSAGRLAQADGGTVFLDEIGELPLEVQAKLLRFVQERTVTLVGGTTVQTIDVRIIAATNRDLEEDVRAGRFREDLFHRLNVVRLRMPPLRERRDDILLLARHFLDVFAMQYQQGGPRVHARGGSGALRIRLGRQRPPAAEHDPAGGRADRRRVDRHRRPATAVDDLIDGEHLVGASRYRRPRRLCPRRRCRRSECRRPSP